MRGVPMTDGILNLNKPRGPTSHDIVNRVRKLTGVRRVGHAGTLDPLATGVLLVCIGRATRVSEYLMGGQKMYRARVRLGITTDTYDITGLETEPRRAVNNDLDLAQLNLVTDQFVGEIEQAPPRFSALKRHGKKLYQLSRKNQKVEIAARKVFVKSFSIVDIDMPILRFRAVVGKGVYIRSLAYDLGNVLRCGATLLSLRRTRIGEYGISGIVAR